MNMQGHVTLLICVGQAQANGTKGRRMLWENDQATWANVFINPSKKRFQGEERGKPKEEQKGYDVMMLCKLSQVGSLVNSHNVPPKTHAVVVRRLPLPSKKTKLPIWWRDLFLAITREFAWNELLPSHHPWLTVNKNQVPKKNHFYQLTDWLCRRRKEKTMKHRREEKEKNEQISISTRSVKASFCIDSPTIPVVSQIGVERQVPRPTYGFGCFLPSTYIVLCCVLS